MRIVVTGASGFIGQKLCSALLDRGHEIFSLCRKNNVGNLAKSDLYRHASYQMGDLLPNEVISFSPEALVHLAWDGIPDFSKQKCLDNLETQIRFFNQIENFKQLKKIICAGTCREYGSKKGKCIEGEFVDPDNYFSWVKQTLYQYLMIFCQRHKLSLVWFRMFFVYGPNQRNDSLIPTLIRGYRANQDPEIKTPHAANDFIYIDDVVNAYIASIEKQAISGVFNLGSGSLATVSKVSQIVKSIFQNNNLSFDQSTGSIFDENLENLGARADISLINKELSWSPKVSLPEGIRRTIFASQYEG